MSDQTPDCSGNYQKPTLPNICEACTVAALCKKYTAAQSLLNEIFRAFKEVQGGNSTISSREAPQVK